METDWKVILNAKELAEWEDETGVYYKNAPKSYPCLARARVACDEQLETEIMTVDDLKGLLLMVQKAEYEQWMREIE